MKNYITADLTVDARGKMGALPTLEASRKLKLMSVGEVMLLIADNDATVDEVNELVAHGVCKMLSHERDDDGLKVFIEKL